MKKRKFVTIQSWLYRVTTILCFLFAAVMYRPGDTNGIISDIEDSIYPWMMGLTIFCCICIELFAFADIFYAWKLYRQGDLDNLLCGVKKIKLGMIPYYIIIYPVGFFLFLAVLTELMPHLSPDLSIVIAHLFLFAIFWMLYIGIQATMTGAYGIFYVKLFRKTYPENKIKRVHYILQILPILDVISSYVLVAKHKQLFSW